MSESRSLLAAYWVYFCVLIGLFWVCQKSLLCVVRSHATVGVSRSLLGVERSLFCVDRSLWGIQNSLWCFNRSHGGC